MFVLLLMLDNPDLMDQIIQAWVELGIRGIYVLESTGCREPEDKAPPRIPGVLFPLGEIARARRFCHALLLAPVEARATAEQAAEAVTRVAGPWAERRTAMMFALPVAMSWGTPPTPDGLG